MNSDVYGAIKRDQQKIIDRYEDIVASLNSQLEAIVCKQAAIKICYETLKTVLEESGGCPVCGGSVFLHRGECEMYEVMATLREIVEG